MNSRYLCLVYEKTKGDALPGHESAVLENEDVDYLTELQMNGHFIVSARLQPAEMAARVHVSNGNVLISDVSATGSNERLGGFYLIEARDLNDAIRIAAKMPRARLGWIDVRRLAECDPH